MPGRPLLKYGFLFWAVYSDYSGYMMYEDSRVGVHTEGP